MPSEEGGARHVGEAIPLRCRSGEEEWLACFAADGGVGGEGDSHVHGVAECVADDGVGAMDAPTEVVSGGGGEDLVLLGVVEVFDVEAGLFFAEWGGGELAFAVGLEWAEVVLEAGDESDVADRFGWGDGLEEIADHC